MINMLVSESKYLKNKNLNIKKDNRPHTIPKKVKSWFNTIPKKKKRPSCTSRHKPNEFQIISFRFS